MKKFKILVVGVLASAFMWGCVAQKSNENVKELQREWMMVSFQNFSKDKLIDYQAKINLVPRAENPSQFSAKMGCNSMFFTSKISGGNKIEFSKVGSTMMLCQDKMDLETAFGQALPTMKFYKVEGHYLTLSDENGGEMKFVAADWD